MNTGHKTISFEMSTLTDSRSAEFGVSTAQHLVIETFVAPTGSPTGAWVLERFALDGTWDTVDIGTEAFTDPSAGAAIGSINLRNPLPGRYRMFYDRTSGGDAAGAQVIVYLGHG